MTTELHVRPAIADDLPRLGALAESLVRLHHAFDPARFLLTPGVAAGYQRWFGQEIQNPDAVLLVAAEGDAVLGYAYGRVEGRDWNMLLDRHGALHDILVDPAARGRRVGEALLEAFLAAIKARGVPRVVLHTAVQNERAQALFAKAGFRPTMLEMTREL
ncbi:MAG: GNAT family N-acetyltransferase [Polyangiales bacterium]